MGVTIGKGSAFLGVPLIKVRNVLKAWHRGDRSDLWRIGERKDIDIDPRTVMVLLEELRDRGLLGLEEQEIGGPRDGLTEAGFALAGAGARKRTPKQQAQRVLDHFLDACAAVNARSDLPFEVREVWLFGSMLDPTKDDVSDIDLVVETGRAPGFETYERAQKRFQQLSEEMGASSFEGYKAITGAEEFVERQLLHGGRRHALLSMHRAHELQRLGCPCQLILDGSRGGRVSDPILYRHPASNGRANTIGEKRRMPDLAEGRQPLRPCSAALMAGRVSSHQVVHGTGPWPEGDSRYPISGFLIASMGLIADGVRPPRYDGNALTKRMQFQNCDGRARTGLLLVESRSIDPSDWRADYAHTPVAAAVFERSIKESGSAVTYGLDVVEADHLGRTIGYPSLLAFEWWIHLMATTDIERLLRREREISAKCDISVEITYSSGRSIAEALDDEMPFTDRSLIDETRERLERQAIDGFRGKDYIRV